MNITYRNFLRTDDPHIVESIVRSTGFFREDEINIAREIAEEKFTAGEESSYQFLFAEIDGKTVAFSCFGLIPCSLISFDLYWIATMQPFRNHGIGRLLLARTEDEVKKGGGAAIYAETSSKSEYESTRVFYLRNGYQLKAELDDFYEAGDNKLIFVKRVYGE